MEFLSGTATWNFVPRQLRLYLNVIKIPGQAISACPY